MPPQYHHEGHLPSQRYKYQRQLPPNLNPIVPQDVSILAPGGEPTDFPPSFLELNAPRQRPPMLGNPMFGYSVHPIAPPVAGMEKITGKTGQRLAELQKMLEHERALRREAEARLAETPRVVEQR